MHAKRFKWMDDGGARGATNSVALGSDLCVASQCWGTRVHRVGTRTLRYTLHVHAYTDRRFSFWHAGRLSLARLYVWTRPTDASGACNPKRLRRSAP